MAFVPDSEIGDYSTTKEQHNKNHWYHNSIHRNRVEIFNVYIKEEKSKFECQLNLPDFPVVVNVTEELRTFVELVDFVGAMLLIKVDSFEGGVAG